MPRSRRQPGDETASGLQQLDGSYQMVYENGIWLIDSANLSKSGC